MEPLMHRAVPTLADGYGLQARLARWTSTAETRLRVGGEWPVAAALREGLELVAEELRVEHEGLRDARSVVEARAARLALLLERAPVALLVTTADGRVCEANAEARRLVGGASARLVGRPLVHHVAVEDRRVFRALLLERGGGDGVREIPLRLRTPADERHDVVALVRSCRGADGERELYWALREDRRSQCDDLL